MSQRQVLQGKRKQCIKRECILLLVRGISGANNKKKLHIANVFHWL